MPQRTILSGRYWLVLTVHNSCLTIVHVSCLNPPIVGHKKGSQHGRERFLPTAEARGLHGDSAGARLRRCGVRMTAIQLLAAIAFGLILAILMSGCSDDFERLQKQAEWQAKVVRTTLPREGELVTIRQLGEGYIVRRYRGGLIATNVLKEDQ